MCGKICDKVYLIPRVVEESRDHSIFQICCYYNHCAAVLADDPSPSSIPKAQNSQLNNNEHSDVTFIVDNQVIFGNSDPLVRKSQYFEAMFRCKMRESIERKVVVSDISTATFLKLLEYLYLGDFAFFDGLDESSRDELVMVADMYLLEGLKILCSTTKQCLIYFES